ncbi:MAG: WG repeat-containing protein [Tannerellaceae bacterium]|nr:WG repeat-containing protein [Tannerellaceae bacterium]
MQTVLKSCKALTIVVLAVATFSCGGGSSNEAVVDLIPVFDGERYTYINNKGMAEVIPEAEVIETSAFRGGYALVGVSVTEEGNRFSKTKYGFIDRSGKLVIPVQYMEATIFSEGLAWVKTDDKAFIAIDKTGKEIIRLPENVVSIRIFREGLAAFQSNERRWGYIDKQGTVVIEPTYKSVNNFSNGLAAVTDVREKCSYIDKNGQTVIPAQFSTAYDFMDDGYAVVGISDGGRWGEMEYGVIDRKGEFVFGNPSGFLLADGDGFYADITSGDDEKQRFGYLNRKGERILPDGINLAAPFWGSNYAKAIFDGDDFYSIIDRKGKKIAELHEGYNIIHPFTNGMAVVRKGFRAGDGMAIMNEKGETLLDLPYPADVADDYLSDWAYMMPERLRIGLYGSINK